MKICLIGCGFVGLTTGAVLAHFGHRVHLVDVDKSRIDSILHCRPPFYEPDLKEFLSEGMKKGRITASTDVARGVKDNDYIFICVQTPVKKSGVSNLNYLKSCTKTVARGLAPGKTVVVKSTVPPQTCETMVLPMLEKYSGLKAGKDFGIAMNPEFLQEGRAVADTITPSRIVVGSDDEGCAKKVMALFAKIKAPRLITDLTTAEMIKLVSNCFLANKISFANEIANLCEKIGTDVMPIMNGVGLDPRIGRQFLNAGLGFGGSCLPKDLSAMISAQRSKGLPANMLRAIRAVNDSQSLRAVDVLEERLGTLKGKRIAILGLAFKSGVDDVRETRALPIANELLARGSIVIGYDKLAGESFKRLVDGIRLAPSAAKALSGADGCIIQTDDPEFNRLSKKDFSAMRTKIVIVGRRPADLERVGSWNVTAWVVGLGFV